MLLLPRSLHLSLSITLLCFYIVFANAVRFLCSFGAVAFLQCFASIKKSMFMHVCACLFIQFAIGNVIKLSQSVVVQHFYYYSVIFCSWQQQILFHGFVFLRKKQKKAIVAQNTKSSSSRGSSSTSSSNNNENSRKQVLLLPLLLLAHKSSKDIDCRAPLALSCAQLLSGRTVASQRPTAASQHTHTQIQAHVNTYTYT